MSVRPEWFWLHYVLVSVTSWLLGPEIKIKCSKYIIITILLLYSSIFGIGVV